jgi:hypothetical protein
MGIFAAKELKRTRKKDRQVGDLPHMRSAEERAWMRISKEKEIREFEQRRS